MHGATGPSIRRLDSELLLRAYSAGLFPMADTREAEDIYWVEPRQRGVLPPERFHLPRSLAKVLKKNRFRHSRDLAFTAVIRHCAAAGPGREQSWINATILDAYVRLHQQGHAHSIETWDADGRLVGGLYGVRLGGAFFGESMFSLATDASKAALAHLVARLRVGGFRLLDTQFLTAHLARFGAVELRRSQYLAQLAAALEYGGDWHAFDRILGLRYPLGGESEGEGAGAAGTAGAESAGAEGGESAAGRPVVPDDVAPALFLANAGAGFGPPGKSIVQLLSQTS